MSKVIELLPQGRAEDDQQKTVAIANAANVVLASSAKFASTAMLFEEHLDAIEKCLDTIEDPEAQCRLRQSTKLARQSLIDAVLTLDASIRTFTVSERANRQ